jgi:hypothetical protein
MLAKPLVYYTLPTKLRDDIPTLPIADTYFAVLGEGGKMIARTTSKEAADAAQRLLGGAVYHCHDINQRQLSFRQVLIPPVGYEGSELAPPYITQR